MSNEYIEKVYEELEKQGCKVYSKGKMYETLLEMSQDNMDRLISIFNDNSNMLLYSVTDDCFVVFIS